MEPRDARSGVYNVIVETPKGSRIKFDWDEEHGLFVYGKTLPEGSSFPFDFGFLPQTLGGDGDPLDVLVLLDAPAFPGVLVPSRLLGVIQAEQTERDGEVTSNDRLFAVAANSRLHRDVLSIDDVAPALLEEIEHFFVSYNLINGKEFRPLARTGPERDRQLVNESVEAWGRRPS